MVAGGGHVLFNLVQVPQPPVRKAKKQLEALKRAENW